MTYGTTNKQIEAEPATATNWSTVGLLLLGASMLAAAAFSAQPGHALRTFEKDGDGANGADSMRKVKVKNFLPTKCGECVKTGNYWNEGLKDSDAPFKCVASGELTDPCFFDHDSSVGKASVKNRQRKRCKQATPDACEGFTFPTGPAEEVQIGEKEAAPGTTTSVVMDKVKFWDNQVEEQDARRKRQAGNKEEHKGGKAESPGGQGKCTNSDANTCALCEWGVEAQAQGLDRGRPKATIADLRSICKSNQDKNDKDGNPIDLLSNAANVEQIYKDAVMDEVFKEVCAADFTDRGAPDRSVDCDTAQCPPGKAGCTEDEKEYPSTVTMRSNEKCRDEVDDDDPDWYVSVTDCIIKTMGDEGENSARQRRRFCKAQGCCKQDYGTCTIKDDAATCELCNLGVQGVTSWPRNIASLHDYLQLYKTEKNVDGTPKQPEYNDGKPIEFLPLESRGKLETLLSDDVMNQVFRDACARDLTATGELDPTVDCNEEYCPPDKPNCNDDEKKYPVTVSKWGNTELREDPDNTIPNLDLTDKIIATMGCEDDSCKAKRQDFCEKQGCCTPA